MKLTETKVEVIKKVINVKEIDTDVEEEVKVANFEQIRSSYEQYSVARTKHT
jgi:hypothetical protein